MKVQFWLSEENTASFFEYATTLYVAFLSGKFGMLSYHNNESPRETSLV